MLCFFIREFRFNGTYREMEDKTLTATQTRTQKHQSDYIICPVCNRGKLIFEDGEADDVPIRLILPGSKRKAKHHIKCGICGSQVGFSFAN